MKKNATIATVAAAAGVAVSTVSRFLNGHYVSQPVRARLGEVIETLGYSRSWTARNLSLGRRGCIAVVVDSSADPWFVQLLTGIEEELSARDTGLMLASLELRGTYDPGLVLEWVHARRVDGIITAKSQRRERPLFRACAEARLPTIAVVPDESPPGAHVVSCDNVAAGIAVARHLTTLGHSRIAFAGGPAHSLDSRHRLRGVRIGLSEAGVGLSPAGRARAAAGIRRRAKRSPSGGWTGRATRLQSCSPTTRWPSVSCVSRSSAAFECRPTFRSSDSTVCRRVSCSFRR